MNNLAAVAATEIRTSRKVYKWLKYIIAPVNSARGFFLFFLACIGIKQKSIIALWI